MPPAAPPPAPGRLRSDPRWHPGVTRQGPGRGPPTEEPGEDPARGTAVSRSGALPAPAGRGTRSGRPRWRRFIARPPQPPAAGKGWPAVARRGRPLGSRRRLRHPEPSCGDSPAGLACATDTRGERGRDAGGGSRWKLSAGSQRQLRGGSVRAGAGGGGAGGPGRRGPLPWIAPSRSTCRAGSRSTSPAGLSAWGGSWWPRSPPPCPRSTWSGRRGDAAWRRRGWGRPAARRPAPRRGASSSPAPARSPPPPPPGSCPGSRSRCRASRARRTPGRFSPGRASWCAPAAWRCGDGRAAALPGPRVGRWCRPGRRRLQAEPGKSSAAVRGQARRGKTFAAAGWAGLGWDAMRSAAVLPDPRVAAAARAVCGNLPGGRVGTAPGNPRAIYGPRRQMAPRWLTRRLRAGCVCSSRRPLARRRRTWEEPARPPAAARRGHRAAPLAPPTPRPAAAPATNRPARGVASPAGNKRRGLPHVRPGGGACGPASSTPSGEWAWPAPLRNSPLACRRRCPPPPPPPPRWAVPQPDRGHRHPASPCSAGAGVLGRSKWGLPMPPLSPHPHPGAFFSFIRLPRRQFQHQREVFHRAAGTALLGEERTIL